MVAHSSSGGRVVPGYLRYVLLNVALLGGCAATRASLPAAAPVQSTAVAAPVLRITPSPAAASVSCAVSDFTPSLLSRAESIPALDAWPLDGSDPAPGNDKENPIMRCGPADSYTYVAAVYRCPDGSNPLGGKSQAGRTARRGNVGDNSHHNGIIDLYEVPCASGTQEVYVNMYGCPDEPGRQPTGKGAAMREPLPPDAAALMNEALDLTQAEHYPEAIAKVNQALVSVDSKLGPDHPQKATLLDLAAALYTRSEQPAQAEQAWAAAYPLWQAADWPPTPLVGNTCLGLASVYAARKQPETTACLAQRAITHLEDIKGSFDSSITRALLLLSAAYSEQGNAILADRMLKRAVRLVETNKGRRHPHSVAVLEELIAFYGARDDKASLALLRQRLGTAH